jgi:hypothetical protein
MGSITSKLIYGALLSTFLSIWLFAGFQDVFNQTFQPAIGVLSYPAGIFLIWVTASSVTWLIVRSIKTEGKKEGKEAP